MLRVALNGKEVPTTDIFVGEEQLLLRAYRRHADCARLLLENPDMIEEADFHAHLAVECLLKHLFCLVRHSQGVKASLQEDFYRLKTGKDFGHDVKNLAEALIRNDCELAAHPSLLELKALLPLGANWNQDRYRERPRTSARTSNIRRVLDLAGTIHCDVSGESNG